jgi:hypothetical protein
MARGMTPAGRVVRVGDQTIPQGLRRYEITCGFPEDPDGGERFDVDAHDASEARILARAEIDEHYSWGGYIVELREVWSAR